MDLLTKTANALRAIRDAIPSPPGYPYTLTSLKKMATPSVGVAGLAVSCTMMAGLPVTVGARTIPISSRAFVGECVLLSLSAGVGAKCLPGRGRSRLAVLPEDL